MSGPRRQPRSDSGRVGGGHGHSIAPRPKKGRKAIGYTEERAGKDASAVRVWVAKAGYASPAPGFAITNGCAVVLYHGALATEDASPSNPLINIATMAKRALTGNPASSACAASCWSHVLAVDMTAIIPNAVHFAAALRREGTKKGPLSKDLGRVVHRTFDRLQLRGATLIAIGDLVPLALKLLLGRSDRSIAAEGEITRVIFIHPELPAGTINSYMRGAAPNAALRVDVVFATDALLERRDAVLRAVFPTGVSCVAATAPRAEACVASTTDFSRVLMLADCVPSSAERAGESETVSAAVDAASEYVPGFTDDLGRTLWLSEMIFDVELQRSATAMGIHNRTRQVEEYYTNLRTTLGIRDPAAGDGGDAASDDDSGEEYFLGSSDEVGACVVRGERCLVVRDGPGRALRLPSVVAGADELPIAAALRAACELAGLDAATLEPIDAVPPVAIYRGKANGSGRRVMLYALRAPVVEDVEEEVEDGDDEAGVQSWVTLSRAESCLDKRTVAGLRTMACALGAAASARRFRVEGGAVFGDKV